MKKTLKTVVCIVAVFTLAVAAAACSRSSEEASATPVPSETVAPMIVVTPAPTPVATPTPEPTAEPSASEGSSGGSGGSSQVLKIEMESEAVREAQERLRALGYLDKVTGYFGTDTERAVKEFQQKNGLDADGMIGPLTMDVLMSEDAKEA